MSYNRIVMVGNLTRDIELRYAQSGTAIANTAIATTRKFTQNGEKKEEVCFVDITFFGRSAEVANQYLHKGSKCLVEGRLKLDQWTDQQGQKRSKHSIVVETMQMLDSKDSQSNNSQTNQGYNQQQQQGQYNQPQQQQGQYNQPQSQPNMNQNNNPAQNGQPYVAPTPTYEDANGRKIPPPNQGRPMPQQGQIPNIDIDEDEIPF